MSMKPRDEVDQSTWLNPRDLRGIRVDRMDLFPWGRSSFIFECYNFVKVYKNT